MIAETLWYVHELELEAVGVDEEHRKVAQLVPVLGGRSLSAVVYLAY